MTIAWTFAQNNGGRETGFNDAGVETFRGNIDKYLAREIMQNSLDARHDPNKPVRVEFKLRKLKRSEVPDMDQLKTTFTRCAEFFADEKKAVAFFKNAEKLAGSSEIQALQISDFNTTGVRGGDLDRTMEWYKLIRCAGSSSKGGGEGGSFGIGKNAPFAASAMRTILYSTLTTDGDHAFQGVATLVSHFHPEGGIAQSTGFLGGAEGMAVRTQGSVPKLFRRNSHGTDIYVLGFPAAAKWVDDLTYSVLDNFWPAIELGDIEVRVGEREITKASLQELLKEFATSEDFTAHLYYEAFRNPTVPPVKRTLPTLGECTVYLLAGAAEQMPKKVAMVRKTGMKIYEKAFRSIIPYCGVFLCRNDKGNKLLRDMEPPRHDEWDPDHPEKGAHKKTHTEFISFIREAIKMLAPVDDAKAIAVPGLHKYLPDDDDTPEESFDADSPAENAESFQRHLKPGPVDSRRMQTKKPMQPDKSDPDGGDNDTEESGDDDGTGGGTGSGSGQGDGGSGAGAGGTGPGDSEGVKGSKGGASPKPPVAIRYRAFPTNMVAGVYRITVARLNGADKGQVNLTLRAVGDDQRTPVEVKEARLLTGASLPTAAGGIVGPVLLAKSTALTMEVVLKEPLRLAMEVAAHET